MQILPHEFVQEYRDKSVPWGPLGEFVYYRTYSRWLIEEKRREFWFETCARAVNYTFGLLVTHCEKNRVYFSTEKLRTQAMRAFDSMFNLETFCSGRTLWVGGTPAVEECPTANFNCAFHVIEDMESICDLFYLLMVGAGIGGRICIGDVEKFPIVCGSGRTELVHLDYYPKDKSQRVEKTRMAVDTVKKVLSLEIGDSKEGWVTGLREYLKAMISGQYYKIEIDYSSVRPKGERLVRFGGRASGYESFMVMITKIHKVLSELDSGKVRPIHLLDVSCIIGENVVVGGVRRTAENLLLDVNDPECIQAKNNYWEDPNLAHRAMSNNSIICFSKPPKETLKGIFDCIRTAAEPNFLNMEAARLRRPDAEGVNPCFEILLADHGLCNLSTIVMPKFVKPQQLLRSQLEEAIDIAVGNCIRLTLVDIELPHWDTVQKRDRLLGVSITGFQDAMAILGYAGKENRQKRRDLLKLMKERAWRTAAKVAYELRIPIPLLVTTVKPEGTLSCLPTVSSGLHWPFASYYIRRVRISSTDPLLQVMRELNYSVYPEVGQEEMTEPSVYVLEFPVSSPGEVNSRMVPALEQLENYLDFQECWSDHNSSNTIYVDEDEWPHVIEWIDVHWNDFVAVSFMPREKVIYRLAPYEEIDEEEYSKRKASFKTFDAHLITRFEQEADEEFIISFDSCESGVCPIR